MTKLMIATVVALALGNALAALAGIATSRISPPAELGPEVMRALGATAVTFTVVTALVFVAFERAWRPGALARILGGALCGAVIASVMLIGGGLRATGPLLAFVLAFAEALVVAGALLGRAWWLRSR